MIHSYRERGQNHTSTVRPHRTIPRTKTSGVSHSSTAEIADSFVGDITDDRGRIRLSCVREEFEWKHLESEKGREIIRRCYNAWVNCPEYLHFDMVNVITGETDKELYVKCSKRGNDVYRWRLRKRLSWIDNLDYEEFFNPKDRNVRGKTTRMLFVNLTYDAKRCSIREAQDNVGKEWNRWISAVRKRYGGVKHYRCFEVHKNGYPHVHAVLLFKDAEFEVSYRDKSNRFRILRAEKDWLAEKWHSFVDVQACYSTKVFGYIKKYMLKVHGDRSEETEDVTGITPEQATGTLSLLWLFRKQSFSVSRGMRETINDLIEVKHNSNSIGFQITLERIILHRFELIDIVTLEEIFNMRKKPPDANKKWSFEFPLTKRW